MAEMRKLYACLGAAALVLVFATHANAQATLKPYVTLILDTSGSMTEATNSGPSTCGGTDQKINHAKCAIQNIANSYGGDIEFALARFRNVSGGTLTGAFPAGCCQNGPGAGSTGCLDGPDCDATDNMFELLAPLVDDIGVGAAKWVNGTGNTCTTDDSLDPEIFNVDSSTPLEGVLRGARRYWTGLQATPVTVTAVKETGTTGTYTTTKNPLASNENDLFAGEIIDVAGVANAGYNGRFTVDTSTATTFTVKNLPAGLPALTAQTGTAAIEIFLGTAAQGFSPIANDPLKNVFLPQSCDPTPTCTVHAPAQTGDCCATQCRPYISILLTDGAETCGGDPASAAAAMLKTQVGPDNYRIDTKPIGFGIAAPSVGACATAGAAGCQIEDIAHAGGALDVPGKLEGFYASDEAGLELAISSIIEGSVRSELCNNLDDDCDTKIDEDFPDKGNACTNGKQGACAATGALVCRADGGGLVCNAGPGPAPGTEICNGIDDDCDGKIDEDLASCGCFPQAEQCNGKDDDCDGKIDEDTDVPCGVNVGVCTTGVQKCACVGTSCGLGACSGNPPCGGATPCVESCNAKDDDCDGIVDGLTEACSTMPPINGHPAGDPANNPGDPGQGTLCDAEGVLCACHPGVAQCPSNSGGVFSACAGEVQPDTDVCNGIDDDCDGKIDEDFVPADCGVCGVTSCVNGAITCAQGTGSAEQCNNRDDDCDGTIDEDVPDGGPCNTPNVCNGTNKCINGAFQCVGTPIVVESCNCIDDDCDGSADNNNGNCPSGSTCTNTGATCECDFPCGNTEFPCPAGKVCDPQKQLCITDLCFGITCGADQSGNAQVCKGGACVNACDQAGCVAPQVCVPTTGQCVLNNCISFPAQCTAEQSCVNGTCTTNPCAGVTCSTDQYCELGSCYQSCAGVTCGAGMRCTLGTCEVDPCGNPCPAGQVCHDADGVCAADGCAFNHCPQGQVCNPADDSCITDPCLGTACPSPEQICKLGTCYDPAQLAPDAGVPILVTAAGGGCDTSGAGGGPWLVGALGALLVGRRRRRRAAGGAA